MPTMQASVGGSSGRNGKEASRPRTKKTCSPTPAPTASTATSVRPAGVLSGATGWRTNSLWLASAGSFSVETTSPMTRASCMVCSRGPRGPRLLLLHVYAIDDADDRGIDGTVLQSRRHARGAAAHDEHGLADASIDGVHGDEIVAFRL